MAALLLLGAGCARGTGDQTPPDASTASADGSAAIVDTDASTSAPACADGDQNVVGPDGHCYMLFTSATATWQGATDLCALIGPTTHLATITSAAEDQLVTEVAGAVDVWIGGSDIVSEAVWTWSTGEAMAYTHWGMAEPNDGGAGATIPEDCMILRKVGTPEDPAFNVGTWDDRACAQMYPFICERP